MVGIWYVYKIMFCFDIVVYRLTRSTFDTPSITPLQNHTLFWENLTPEETSPGPETTKAIAEAFGDLEALKADLSAKSIAVQGSGWGWLGYNKATKRIEVATCANQDPLAATTGLVPLLGIDVWEHGYYLQVSWGTFVFIVVVVVLLCRARRLVF